MMSAIRTGERRFLLGRNMLACLWTTVLIGAPAWPIPPWTRWRVCEESYFFNKENPAMKAVYFLALQFSCCKKRESIFRATVLHMISIHLSSSIVLFVIYYRAAIFREEQCHKSR